MKICIRIAISAVALKAAADLWWKEIKTVGLSDVNKLTLTNQEFNRGIGHWTQVCRFFKHYRLIHVIAALDGLGEDQPHRMWRPVLLVGNHRRMQLRTSVSDTLYYFIAPLLCNIAM